MTSMLSTLELPPMQFHVGSMHCLCKNQREHCLPVLLVLSASSFLCPWHEQGKDPHQLYTADMDIGSVEEALLNTAIIV